MYMYIHKYIHTYRFISTYVGIYSDNQATLPNYSTYSSLSSPPVYIPICYVIVCAPYAPASKHKVVSAREEGNGVLDGLCVVWYDINLLELQPRGMAELT